MGVAGFVETVAQERHSRVAIAALDDDQCIETGCPKPPKAYRVTVGMFQQIRTVAFRGVQIASEIGDRARALSKNAAEG